MSNRKQVVDDEEAGNCWPLPTGWRWELLDRYFSTNRVTINPAAHPTEVFELYSVPSFPSGHPEIASGNEIGSTKQFVAPDDVLVRKINPRISRVWRVDKKTEARQIASTEWIRLSGKEELDPDFLKFYLVRDQFRNFLAHNVSGVGGSFMRVRPVTLGRFPVPVPPLKVQQAIAARINALSRRSTTARPDWRRRGRTLRSTGAPC